MGILDLFRPKWKNSNASIRIEAVQKLTDESILTQMALSDEERKVRWAATDKITNQTKLAQTTLAQIALSDKDHFVRYKATEKITDQKILTQIALSDDDQLIRQSATEKITDQTILAEIALSDSHDRVRNCATKKIIDQKILTQIALSDDDKDVRLLATEKTTNQTILAEIALSDKECRIRLAAVKNLEDQNTLEKIALSDKDYNLRVSAIEKIIDQITLTHIALSDDDFMIRLSATKKITDQTILAQIAFSNDHEAIREIAIKNLEDQNTLTKIALSDKDDSARLFATEKITDQIILTQIALSNVSKGIREIAIKNLVDQNILVEIATTDFDHKIRLLAAENIKDQDSLIKIAREDKVYSVRATAIGNLEDQNILTKFAIEEDEDNERIALVTARNIKDQSNLSKIALQAKSKSAREFAAPLVTNKLVKGKLVLSSLDHLIREEIIESIFDEFILAQIIQIGEQQPKILKHAMENAPKNGAYFKYKKQESELIEKVKNLTDSDKLSEIAQNHMLINVRIEAILKLNDQDILTEISKNEIVYKARFAAIKRIINFSTLLDISKTDWDLEMREEVLQLLLERLQTKNAIDKATENLSKEITSILLKVLKSNYKSLETKESFLPYLLKSSNPEVFDAIFNWLLNTYHPLSQSTIALLKAFCPDYSDILIDLRNYELKSEYWDGGYSNDGGGSRWNNERHTYDEKLMNQATKKLCEIKTSVSSNLLYLITMRKSISITLSVTCMSTSHGDLDWHTQKKIAIDELKNRGNPAYDSSLYIRPNAWQIKNK